MANIILRQNDSQNVYGKAKLFLIWCALTKTLADTGAFIIHHFVEVAKTTHSNVIGVRGTITAITHALGYIRKFGTLKAHFLGGNLDIVTLAHMTIIDIKGGINEYRHHKQILFTFPDVVRTPIPN